MPSCKVCGNPVNRFIKSSNSWWDWCSNKCMGADPAILEKKKKTNLQKFGVDHPMQLSDTKNKLKQTNLHRYGYENPFLDSEVQKKIKEVNIQKYGVSNPSKNKDVIKKIREKKLNNYFTSKSEIIEKRRNTYINKLGVTSNKHTHIPKDSVILMKNLEWICNQHFNLKKSCEQIAIELGISPTPILMFLSQNNINVIRHSTSKVEKEIRNFLSSITNEKIIYNDRTILNKKELDIYIPSRNLAIEINGVYWHSEEYGKDQSYHLSKTTECEEKNIHLLHIYDTEWNDPITSNIIKSKLRHLFNLSNRIHGRKCYIKEIDNTIANQFLIENHIQGKCPSKYRVGLYYKDELMALATFGISRFNKSYQLELLRYCNKTNNTIIGGLSKIIQYMINTHELTSLISYADRRWTPHSSSTLYDASGFTFLHESPPNYKYFKINSNKVTLLSRNQFQKHMLASKLEIYDQTLTGYENMLVNGYHRIWDCGNLVYTFNTGKQ